MRASQDRGLCAVRRVRDVRERDSRLGLARAAAEQAGAEERARDLRTRLSAWSTIDDVSPAELLTRHLTLRAMGEAVRTADDAAAAAARLTATAQVRWQLDHTRRAAIQLLLDRRAATRAALARRAEDRQSDDLTGQAWLRDRRAES